MLCILEGPDGVGKTTLADQLAEYIRRHRPSDTVEIWRKGPPTLHPLDEYVTPLIAYRPGTNHHIICDRWHWGEMVYPQVFGRASLMDSAMFTYVELFLQSRGALVVNVMRDLAATHRALRERGDDLVRPDQLPQIVSGYMGAVYRSRLTSCDVVVDSDVDRAVDPDAGLPGDITASYVIAEGMRADLKARILNPFTTYVGSYKPRTLLVGDVRGPGDKRALGPAFMPYGATSGAFLLKSLTVTQRAHALGIVNGCDVDSLVDVVQAVAPAEIVALGRNAYDACKAQLPAATTVQFGAVPHPQFVRRFHNAHHEAYGFELLYAASVGEDSRSWRP